MLCFHFAVVPERRKVDLTQGFIHGNGHRIAQIQASGVCLHGNTHTFFIVCFQKSFRKSFGLLAEKEIAAVMECCLHIAPGCFCGQTPHFGHLIFRKEILQVFVIKNLHHVPVIQSGTADRLLRDVKSQRTDQMKPAAGGCKVRAMLPQFWGISGSTSTIFSIFYHPGH